LNFLENCWNDDEKPSIRPVDYKEKVQSDALPCIKNLEWRRR
jgi:hypothetical protein